MKEEHIVEEIMKKLSIKADDVVLSLIKSEDNQIKFSNNKISNNTLRNFLMLDVFLAMKKKVIVTSIKNFDPENVDKTIKDIFSFGQAMPASKEYEGIAQGPFKYQEIPGLYDPKVKAFNPVDLVDAGVNSALDIGAKRVSGILKKSTAEVFLLTSNNVEAREKGTHLYFSIRSLVDKYATGHNLACSRMLKSFDVENAAVSSAKTAVNSVNPLPGKVGKFDILFDPLPFANILNNFAESTSIFSVEAGLSCLKDKLNKKVAGEKVNLFDDSTVPGGFGSTSFDAEGVPSQRTQIIKNGVLKNFLHNTSTAKRYNTKTTGNAGLVSPSAKSVIFEKGDVSKSEMIDSMKKGILVTNIWYTRFQNYDTGDFSTIPRDGIFYVEDGEIKYPIKEIRITENILNILKSVELIGNNPMQIRGWEVDTPVITPCVLVKDLNISKPVE